MLKMSTAFSQEELDLVSHIFARADIPISGIINGEVAVRIFAGSVGLSTAVLSDIWNIADEEMRGGLTQRGVAIVIRLIGWAQQGKEVRPELVNISTASILEFPFDGASNLWTV